MERIKIVTRQSHEYGRHANRSLETYDPARRRRKPDRAIRSCICMSDPSKQRLILAASFARDTPELGLLPTTPSRNRLRCVARADPRHPASSALHPLGTIQLTWRSWSTAWFFTERCQGRHT